ncbi:hypothetical protein [Treponema lecithinolyticum]
MKKIRMWTVFAVLLPVVFGSGESGTAQQIQLAYSKAVVFKALAMRRQTAQKMADAAKRDTLKWLAEIKVK